MKKILILFMSANILLSSPSYVKDGSYLCVGFAVADKKWKIIYKLNEIEMKRSIIRLDKKNDKLIDTNGVIFELTNKNSKTLTYKNDNTTIMLRNKYYKNEQIVIGINSSTVDKNALYICSTKSTE